MEVSKRFIVLGVGAALALLAVVFSMVDALGSTDTTSATGGGPEMALTVTAGGTCDDSGCTVPSGGSFTLAAEIVSAPPEYILAQTYIIYGENLTYTETAAAADEILWPDCETAVAVRGSTAPNSVLHGCLTGLIPPLPTSSYVGNYNALAMTCAADGAHVVQIIPAGVAPALTNGALFKDAGNADIVPKVSDLTITCGEGGGGPTNTPGEPTDTPAGPTNTPVPPTNTPAGPTNTPVQPTNTPAGPTNTPRPPTSTPRPSDGCGDVDKDGRISAVDSLWVLWWVAGLLNDLPADEANADVDGDGDIDAFDAALIRQHVAGLLDELDC